MVKNKAGYETIFDPRIRLTPQLAFALGIGENALQSVILYYGVGCEPLSARATATKLGLSESHVRSLLKRGLRIA
jgi:hypothetical protein